MSDLHTEHLFRRDGRLTELTLDRYRLGELSADERRAVEDRLAQAPEERAVLEAMREFEGAHGLAPPKVATPPQAKVLPFSRPLKYVAPVAVGLVAAAAALSLIAPTTEMAPTKAVVSGDEFRVKGARFELEIHAHDGDRSRRLSAGATVKAGERLGFRVEGGDGGHLLIAGIDAKHAPYLCYPQDTGGASAPAPGGTEAVALPAAVRLDDSPGAETVVAMLCPQPFTYDSVKQAMREAHSLGGALPVLRDGCVQRVIPLSKEAP